MPSETGSGCFSDFITMFASRFNLKIDRGWTVRQTKMHILKKLLKGTLYDNLAPWWMEYNSNNYVPLIQRRPCIKYNLPKIIVEKSSSMLFGEEHFPTVRCEEQNVNDFLQYIARQSNFPNAMLCAARKGSLGSVCIIIKVLDGKFYLDVLGTADLTPIFDPKDPCILISLIQRIKCLGEALRQQGYKIAEKDKLDFYYVVREWTDTKEIYYMPYKCEEEEKQDFRPIEDKERSSVHDWGFLPTIWIKNSPSCNKVDGECTFESIIDLCVEIDYQISQLGRLLRYNSDPMMVVRDTAGINGDKIMRGGGHMLNLGRDGEAYMLEITGESTKAVIDYIKLLREFALEVVRGDRSNPDKISSVHSGTALKMLQTALISLVGEQRLCYGENGLLKIYKMILKMCATGKYDIDDGGFTLSKADYESDLTLDWPDWYPLTAQEELQKSQALTTLNAQGKVISNETATESIADDFGIVDVKKELKSIENDVKLAQDDKSIPNSDVVRQKSKSVVRKKVGNDRNIKRK